MILNGLNIDEWKNENERLRAEIADLRRQLREPPAIGFYPESGRCVWDQKALDANVQEKVDRAVLAESEWFSALFGGESEPEIIDRFIRERLAANRAKAKPAGSEK